MEKANAPSAEERLITLIGAKSRNLFTSGQLWCSEAVLVTLNQSLNGGLSRDMAEGLTMGMGGGLGGSGCLCGAVNGAVVALGLFLAGCEPSMRLPAKTVRAHARELETAFNDQFGSACCRILTCNGKTGGQTKRERCAGQTAFAAEYAARIILCRRPDLVAQADLEFLNHHQGRAATFLKMISGRC